MTAMKHATSEQFECGLLRICQDVHMTTVGAFERSCDDQVVDVRYLLQVTSAWEPSASFYPESTKAYDAVVRTLVSATLAEVEEYVCIRKQQSSERCGRVS